MQGNPRFTNRLAKESSPYLLQHAHNPVDWYPWGGEAFEAARREGKAIFLSVGYSTCYWCHVMERESFENEEIAKLMNESFINIKVDREQRPDVDQLYMLAVQLLTRSGGWPMSVWLTPDLKPFYGGTYFPPADYGGRSGFPTVLRSLADAWKNRRDEVDRAAEGLVEALQRFSLPQGAEHALTIDEGAIENIIGRSVSDFDRKWGGFGGAPKFPRETLLELLLAYCDQMPRDTAARQSIRGMLKTTLDRMARGGIRDQLGGGFHRYSTDAQWLVPHFEIMLYDNAMLLVVYAWAAGLLEEREFGVVARGIADFVLKEMTGKDGEFFTAFDAEVDGREGQSYLWTREQVAQLLSEEQAAVFNRVYGLLEGPNFADPHHGSGQADANVLWVPVPMQDVARELGTTAEELEEELRPARAALLEARKGRKQPGLDTKVLTSWNALMIRGLAFAGAKLKEPAYITAAERAASFLLQHHRTADGGLWRVSRDGVPGIPGFLDDYAGLAHALHELHRATGDEKWLTEADAVVEQMLKRFGSPAGVLYFTDASAEEILVRQVVASDSPLPSGNAMAARVLMELGKTDVPRAIIAAFADSLDAHGEAYSALTQAAMEYVERHGAIEVEPRQLAGELMGGGGSAAVQVSVEQLDDKRARVLVSIADGYHLYGASAPAGMKAMRLLAPAGVEVRYPAPTGSLPMPDGGAAVPTYSGRIAVEVESTKPLDDAKCYLEYQACTDTECLAAERIELVL